jgi:sigma-B regulation protein RsbU (phosphoserine phosphatase)
LRLSIRWKLVLGIGFPILLIYLGGLAITVVGLKPRAVRDLQRRATRLAAHYAGRVDAELHAVARAGDSIASFLNIEPEATGEQLQKLLRSIVVGNELIHSAGIIVERSGRPGAWNRVAVSMRRVDGLPEIDESFDFGARGAEPPGWYTQARASGAPVWTGPYFAEGSEGLVICAYAMSLDREETVRGVAVVELSIPALHERVGLLELPDGHFALVSRDGAFLSHPNPDFVVRETLFSLAERFQRPDVGRFARRMTAGESGVIRTTILSRPGPHWVVFAPVQSTGWSFSAAVPESVVMAFADSQRRRGLAILLAGLAVILLCLLIIAARITRPIARLAIGVQGLSRGDLDVQVSGTPPGDEIGDLTRAFNRMVRDLKEHTEALTRETAAREAIESELRVARIIQTSLLPKTFPPFPERKEFDLHAINVSARQVAGDFFDFFFLSDDRLAVIMADVSGKGTPAALLMAVTRTIMRNAAAGEASPGEVLARANAILCMDSPDSMFVTLFLGLYDPNTGALHYANAGHTLPLRVDREGNVTQVGEPSAPPLGIVEGLTFPEGKDHLELGDRVLLYTDGVTEAADPRGELYGDDRLQAFLSTHAQAPAQELCERLAAEVDAFQEMDRQDDTTILVLQRNDTDFFRG